MRLGASEEKRAPAKGKGKKGAAEDDWEEEEGSKARGKKGGKTRGGDRLAGVTVRRYFRPEDISLEQAYKAGSYYEVYASGGWGGWGGAWCVHECWGGRGRVRWWGRVLEFVAVCASCADAPRPWQGTA